MAGPRIGQVAGPRSASRLSGAATRRGIAWSLTAARVGHLSEGVGVPADNLSSERPRESTAVAQLPRKFSIPLLRRTKCVIALRLSGQESKSFPVLTHFVRGGKTELKWRYKTRGHQTQKCPRARGSRALSVQRSGQTRHAVAPVDRTGLDCLDAVMRLAFLQVIEQRDRLMRSNNNQRCPKRQVVHRSK